MQDIQWHGPVTFTCDSCGAETFGCIDAAGFGERVTSMPPGWLVGFQPDKKRTFYACGPNCKGFVDDAPDSHPDSLGSEPEGALGEETP